LYGGAGGGGVSASGGGIGGQGALIITYTSSGATPKGNFFFGF
jgi:hypothetical protein